MRKKKSPKPKSKEPVPLIVYSNIWEKTIVYRDREGMKRNASCYQEARDYAAKSGYDGIRVKYCPIEQM